MILKALEADGSEYVVLHGRAALLRGELTSDLDIMTRDPAKRVISRLVQRLAKLEIHLVFIWESDLGTVNTFWSDRNLSTWAQLDILHDPRGDNRFGFRTQEAFKRGRPGARTLDARSEHTYLVAKRLAKGQYSEFVLERSQDIDIDRRLLARRMQILVVLPPSRALVGVVGKATVTRSRLSRAFRRGRIAQGHVLFVSAADINVMSSALEHLLPRVKVAASDSMLLRLATRVFPELVLIQSANAGPNPLEKLIARAHQRLTALP